MALRPSCYECPYTLIERDTDITIGDFWGIDKKIPDFYDSMGTSLFIIHNQKGMELFDSVKTQLDYRECTIEECMQSHLEKPTEKPENRFQFWIDYYENGINMILKKYTKKALYI